MYVLRDGKRNLLGKPEIQNFILVKMVHGITADHNALNTS